MSAFNGYLFACLLGSCILGALAQSCVQDETNNLQSCLASFMNVMKDMGSDPQSPPDPAAIMQLMCEGEGKAAIMCFIGVLERCPELSKDGGATMSRMPINMTQIMATGGMDQYCNMMSGPCAKLQQCFKLMPTLEPDADLPGFDKATMQRYMTNTASFHEAKSYLFFMQQTDIVCGKFRPLLECIMNSMDQCVEMTEEITENIEKGIKSMTPEMEGVRVMTFKEQKDFIASGCNSLPQGFSSNTCLQGQLMSADFTTCHQNFSSTYKTKADKQSCSAYEALENCFDDHVKPKCGVKMSSYLAQSTPLLVEGIASKCVKQTSGSSKPLAAYGMTIVIGIYLILAAL